MLNWRTVTPSRSPSYEKNGTELECAIVPGTRSRFQVCSIRKSRYVKDSRAADGYGYVELDCTYVVRDAETVSDADVKAGIRPKIVFDCKTLDEALKFCQESVGA
ncbi:hypothetical protein PHIN3_371 [Sinorhizobium phage phiN3]|uniref:Uncharacterized protein n=1 Tax=Sinorhizobium phage phiN3 TaxID=1647405 RepID=A0A0F6WCU7_9CAUD|nr:hypothetical protein AVT40_gp162 [Sinorhizobium phage phiN3]AKF13634.1 hypothetical protein PHIN3_371 [Sinorhizobium phage phiN3]